MKYPSVPIEPDLDDIKLAYSRLRGVIPASPFIRSGYFSRLIQGDVFLKLENLQETGSFKVRGAYYRLLQLNGEDRKRGVIAASAGNHAQGVAWAATRLGIKSTIVMPESAPLRKYLAVKDYGADVIQFGHQYHEAYSRALQISRETGSVLIPAFDDFRVICGQGTIGVEIQDALDENTAVLVPVGGGGLISGIGAAVKSINPATQVIGVQARGFSSMARSLEKGSIVSTVAGATIADGIAVNQPGELTFGMAQKYVDRIIEVDEDAIAGAVLNLMEKTNVIAEGAGAVPLAALFEDRAARAVKRCILIISGGNIDINVIDRILHRGAIKMGRMIRIEANIPDLPGALRDLLTIVAKTKANILNIDHDRLDPSNPIDVSRVTLDLETRGHEHGREILDILMAEGYAVSRIR